MNLLIEAEYVFLGLAVSLFFLWIFFRKTRFWLPVLLLLGGAFIGGIRMQEETVQFEQEERLFEKESFMELTGKITSIRETENGIELELTNCRIKTERKESRVRKILCYPDEGESELFIGQKIAAAGQGKAADPARNPGGFHYRFYCRAKGISGIFYAKQMDVTGGRKEILPNFLCGIRKKLTLRLKTIAQKKDAGILAAVLFGEKNDLDDNIYELYRKNGISHLLAISGLHVSIIGMGIWKVFRKGGIGFWLSGTFAGTFLCAYGLMVGAGPSVIRAVSMAMLSFLAAALGRTYDLPTALCIPGAGLLLLHPFLLTQASFELSFLAVFSLCFPGSFFTPDRKAGFQKMETFKSSWMVGLSLQMMTAPVILWHSFTFPLYAIWLNLLVIPLMTYVVISGFLGLFGSFFSLTLGRAMLGGGHYILTFYEFLCRKIQELPGAELLLGRPKLWQIAVYYGLVVFAAWFYKEQKHIVKHANAWLVGVWMLAFLILLPIRTAGLTVTFLDVGQGDGILLETSDCRILVDCGSSQQKNPGEKTLVPYLKSRALHRVDLVIMTHGDQDHINGIRELLEQDPGIEIGGLMMPKAGQDEIYQTMAELAEKKNIPVFPIGAGDRLEGLSKTDLSLICLSPSKDAAFSDRNEESLVFLVKFGDCSMLLTGDLGKEGEIRLLEEGRIKESVTLLKAGHHGSAGSTCQEFLDVLSPEIVILSYGRGNRYGHPSGEVMERLKKLQIKIYETGKSGAISVWTDGKKVKVKCMLPESGV